MHLQYTNTKDELTTLHDVLYTEERCIAFQGIFNPFSFFMCHFNLIHYKTTATLKQDKLEPSLITQSLCDVLLFHLLNMTTIWCQKIKKSAILLSISWLNLCISQVWLTFSDIEMAIKA